MANFNKKISPEHFEAILSGKKKYELRLNEFDIKEGDTLVLEEWTLDTPRIRTGRTLEKQVTMVNKFRIDELFWPEEEVREKGLQIISFE